MPFPLTALAAFFVLVGGLAYGNTKEQYISKAGPAIYILSILLVGIIIINSGNLTSPLLVLWLAVAVFAGLFGWYGLGGLLALANGFLIYSVLSSAATRMDIINGVLVLDLPILLSYMLWHGSGAVTIKQPKQSDKLSQSLKSEAAKSSTIIQSISDGVIMTTDSGEITLINPAAQKMTGWSAADALNLHVGSVIRLENDKGLVMTEINHPALQSLNNKKPHQASLIMVTKSEKRFATDITVTPLDEGGVIALFRDVTKERAEEREQAEFISTASHEMRTPVASIEGFLGLALNEKVARVDEKAREYISKAHESAQYLGRLLQDLLEVSRAEDGRLKNNVTVVDAIEVSKSTAESLLPKAEEKGLKLIYKPISKRAKTGDATITPVLYVRADKDRLRESLANLIENAIKYTPSGQISINITATNEYVRFSVTDTGIGIPPEDISHLFQKFYRVDNSDTREINGTGLGLYLTRRLVESMNGKIGAESKHRKGSTFYIDLPRIHNAQASAMIEEANRRAASQAKQAEIIKEQSIPSHDSPTEDASLPPVAVEVPDLNNATPPQTQPVVNTDASASAPISTEQSAAISEQSEQSSLEEPVKIESQPGKAVIKSSKKLANPGKTALKQLDILPPNQAKPPIPKSNTASQKPEPPGRIDQNPEQPPSQTKPNTSKPKTPPSAKTPYQITHKSHIPKGKIQPPIAPRTLRTARPNTPLSRLERRPGNQIPKRQLPPNR